MVVNAFRFILISPVPLSWTTECWHDNELWQWSIPLAWHHMWISIKMINVFPLSYIYHKCRVWNINGIQEDKRTQAYSLQTLFFSSAWKETKGLILRLIDSFLLNISKRPAVQDSSLKIFLMLNLLSSFRVMDCQSMFVT